MNAIQSTIKTFITLVCLMPVLAFGAKNTITVIGTGDADVDRAAIVQAIDDAEEGTTILLLGHFQIGKFIQPGNIPNQTPITITKSKLTITGDRTGGTWNTVITGLQLANGRIPTSDPTIGIPPGSGLLGFLRIGPVTDQTISDITIKDLKIVNMSRAIFVGPQSQGNSNDCADTITTNGVARHITIKDNWFEHTARAAQIFGTSYDILLQNNIVHNNEREAFYVQGFGTTCFNSPLIPPFNFFFIGTPSNINIEGNHIYNDLSFVSSANQIGLRIYYGENVTIKDNLIANGRSFPVLLAGTVNSKVTGNIISNAINGIVNADRAGIAPDGTHPVTQNLHIDKNQISNMTGFGIIVSAETTDTHIKDNTYMNNVLGDVSLSAGPPPSFENTVNEAPGTVIIDNGVNNKIN